MAFVTSGAASIYYEVAGEGPALVFAHGRGGNAASWWQQVPAFARNYKVVVFDHRCFGRSQCRPEDFDREQFDRDLIAILDAEGIEKAAIVCQSMGGWTGLRTALRHPGRVSCLVLSNTPGGIDTPAIRQALSDARQVFADEGVGSAAVARDYPERCPEGAFLYRQIGDLNLQIPAALEHGGEALVSTDELDDFAVPTLVITSEHDSLFPAAAIREVAGHIPGAEIVELPLAGHSPYFETPEQFNQTISPFLARHAG